jgi:hypothetical protein
MFDRLKARAEWKLFGVLLNADRSLAIAWWAALALRGLLPALFAIAMGALVGAVQRGNPLGAPLIAIGAVFVMLQILPPFHHAVGSNLGSRTAAWLYDQLTIACVSAPGMGHLEDPRLTTDLPFAVISSLKPCSQEEKSPWAFLSSASGSLCASGSGGGFAAIRLPRLPITALMISGPARWRSASQTARDRRWPSSGAGFPKPRRAVRPRHQPPGR